MSARNKLWRGLNARVENTAHGQRVSGSVVAQWRHPWEIDCAFVEGQWRGTVTPGFVNGRPAFIDMPSEWLRAQVSSGVADEKDFGINPLTGQPYFSDWVFNQKVGNSMTPKPGGPGGPVRLTHDPAPTLVLDAWRSPLVSSGLSAGLDGELVYGKGEGYPKFFDSLGVKRPAPGGKNPTLPEDPQRTREIRALDVVLTQPRPGSALGITLLDPLTQNFTHQLDTTFTTAYFNAQEGRAKLAARSKHVPLTGEALDSPFLGLPMNAGDPQIDQLRMATVWVLSPPGYSAVDEPDQTWEAYVEHFVFWNLWHAVRFVPPPAKMPPLKLNTGLGLGILDFLGNALLAPINAAMDEANVFLNQSDMRGQFWTT